MLFDDLKQTSAVYQMAIDGFGDLNNSDDLKVEVGQLDGLGEQASYVSMFASILAINFTSEFIDMVFIHCHAVVHILLPDTRDLDNAVKYGERLDERLTSLVYP